jgi:16S rRNA C1402 (ribose-2'-O) methylase RsmI
MPNPLKSSALKVNNLSIKDQDFLYLGFLTKSQHKKDQAVVAFHPEFLKNEL